MTVVFPVPIAARAERGRSTGERMNFLRDHQLLMLKGVWSNLPHE